MKLRAPFVPVGIALLRIGATGRIVLWLCLPLSIAPDLGAEEIDLPKLTRDTRPAVALLTIFGNDGKEVASATGFFISDNGKLVSNWHVAKDAYTMEGRLESGRTFKLRGVLAYSPKEDVALLQADPGQFYSLSLGSAANTDVGSRVVVVGSPLGLEGTVSDGIVSAKRKIGADEIWLQITAPISPGSSGSPVLNSSGQVIGIAVGSSKESGAQAVNFAASSDTVRRLLERAAAGQVVITFDQIRREAATEKLNDPRASAAFVALRSGDYGHALDQFQKLIAEYPNNSALWHLQGAVFASLEFWKDAANSFQRANELNSEMPENWFDLGICQINLRHFDQAIDSFRVAIKLNPRYFKAWYNLGDSLEQQEQWSAAEKAYRTAVKLNPLDGLAIYHVGWCLKEQDKLDDALACYKQAAMLLPRNAYVWNSIAAIYLTKTNDQQILPQKKQQEGARAVEAARHAVQLDPFLPEAWNNLALASAMTRDWVSVRIAADQLRELGSADYYNQALRLLSLTDQKIATLKKYRVVGVPVDDYLNIREGPGADYSIIGKLDPGQRGIVFGGQKPLRNGSTVWQLIYFGSQTGWVAVNYLVPEQ